jgi:hypothetical protein
MAKSTRVNVKAGEPVGVRIQPGMARGLDDWRRKQDDLPASPEAIRRLVELGLKKGNRTALLLLFTQSNATPPITSALTHRHARVGRLLI